MGCSGGLARTGKDTSIIAPRTSHMVHCTKTNQEPKMRRIAALAAITLAAATLPVHAKTLRWSSQGDYLTADPMSQNELLTNSINGHVYEPLIVRDKALKLVPGLAVSWKQTGP